MLQRLFVAVLSLMATTLPAQIQVKLAQAPSGDPATHPPFEAGVTLLATVTYPTNKTLWIGYQIIEESRPYTKGTSVRLQFLFERPSEPRRQSARQAVIKGVDEVRSFLTNRFGAVTCKTSLDHDQVDMLWLLHDLGFQSSTSSMEKALPGQAPVAACDGCSIAPFEMVHFLGLADLYDASARWHQQLDPQVYWGNRVSHLGRMLYLARSLMGDDLFLLGDVQGEQAGFVWGSIAADGRGEVVELFVNERVRGRGLGRHLLSAVEQSLQKAGASRITLDVSSRNIAAMRFYERQGYQRGRNSFYRVWEP